MPSNDDQWRRETLERYRQQRARADTLYSAWRKLPKNTPARRKRRMELEQFLLTTGHNEQTLRNYLNAKANPKNKREK